MSHHRNRNAACRAREVTHFGGVVWDRRLPPVAGVKHKREQPTGHGSALFQAVVKQDGSALVASMVPHRQCPQSCPWRSGRNRWPAGAPPVLVEQGLPASESPAFASCGYLTRTVCVLVGGLRGLPVLGAVVVKTQTRSRAEGSGCGQRDSSGARAINAWKPQISQEGLQSHSPPQGTLSSNQRGTHQAPC